LKKVLLHLAPGTKEDTASCTAFFEDLKRRGLADPLLAVTDGAPGLIRAVETCFPRALRQRCLVHRMRNLRSKAPESQWPEIALRARGCYEAASRDFGSVSRDTIADGACACLRGADELKHSLGDQASRAERPGAVDLHRPSDRRQRRVNAGSRKASLLDDAVDAERNICQDERNDLGVTEVADSSSGRGWHTGTS